MKKLWETVDRSIFFIGATICLSFVIWTVLTGASTETVFNGVQSFFSVHFGWFYLTAVSFFIAFLMWLALGKYGHVRLGKDDEKPQYSLMSWFAMLFAAGMGIGLVFWSVAEPMSHYLSPAFLEGRTTAAASEAMRASFTHWGIHPWAIYGMFGLPLAYFQFRKNKPALVSSCLESLIGEKQVNGVIGKTVDIVVVIATVFGVATSLGLGSMQINSGLHYIFGIPYSNNIMLFIIVGATVLFILSSVSGIDRGIKVISDTNMVLMIVLLGFIFLCGAKIFVANFFVDSVGKYLSSLVSVSFWTDPFKESNGWLSAWTVFYWAWWMSWGPFVGGFIARISRGRTIREFVIGTMLVPSLFCCIFMCVMGGNAIYWDMQGVTGIADALNENVSYALFAMLEQFPFTKLVSALFVILLLIFFISSADSSTFVCSSMTSKGIQNPSGSVKVIWGVFEGIVAVILLYSGGLSAVQSVSVTIGFPLMILCLFIAASLIRSLREESKD